MNALPRSCRCRPRLLAASVMLVASPSFATPPVGWSSDLDPTATIAPRAADIPATDTGTTTTGTIDGGAIDSGATDGGTTDGGTTIGEWRPANGVPTRSALSTRPDLVC